jgi:hypothetical protein
MALAPDGKGVVSTISSIAAEAPLTRTACSVGHRSLGTTEACLRRSLRCSELLADRFQVALTEGTILA